MSKTLKDQIVELELKHSVIAENLIDAIWVLDTGTLKFEYATPSIEKISGYSPEEFTNLTIIDRLAPESLKDVKAVLTEEIRKFQKGIRAIRTLEVEMLHKNGDRYWVEIRARLIKESDKSLKVLGITKEITNRKKAEQEKDELVNKLGAALAEKEKLLKEVKVLQGLLPICSGCKRIRDESGRWWPIDAYVRARTEADLTHTICPDCTDVLYDDLK